MQVRAFRDFTVYNDNANYTFIHVDIKDDVSFYKGIFDYFFEDSRMLRYVENDKGIAFTPSRKGYSILYRELYRYIDEENMTINLPALDKVLHDVLDDEGVITRENGLEFIRKDKIGKIGEYIFSVLLSEYFNFDCVIPKVHLQTDYNMSVFGIDTLFYSGTDDMLLFGESKCSVKIENGIELIKASLKGYEKQITDEYKLVLCNRLYKDKLHIFAEKYGDYSEVCVDFYEFIAEAGVKKIGIPLFIAHGTEADANQILNSLNKIPRKKILGLDTYYYVISLPIVNKQKMVMVFTDEIRKKEILYAASR